VHPSLHIAVEHKAQDDSLAIDHKLLDAVLQGGLGHPRVALRPVIAATRDQPHPAAITLNAEAEAVMLDFGTTLAPGTFVALVGRQNSNALNMRRGVEDRYSQRCCEGLRSTASARDQPHAIAVSLYKSS
jgi:hypothetical protein